MGRPMEYEDADVRHGARGKALFNWLLISGIAFLLSLSAAAILIIYGKELNALGIADNFYYIILIPLGFSSAAFLAGAMKSYAAFKSKVPYTSGTLNLSGPIVIFCLVVGGGFIMPNFGKQAYFDMRMRFIRTDAPDGSIDTGKVVITIGNNQWSTDIHDGEVHFPTIPKEFLRHKMIIYPPLKDYRLRNPDTVLTAGSESIYNLELVPKAEFLKTSVSGFVSDNIDRPVQNAHLDFANGLAIGKTDDHGNFRLVLPLRSGSKVVLKILTQNIIRFNEEVTLSSDIPINIKLPTYN